MESSDLYYPIDYYNTGTMGSNPGEVTDFDTPFSFSLGLLSA